MNSESEIEKRVFFSVIIPIFNKVSHLERSIHSVLNQSHTDFELILIDDNSTDGSFEKINAVEDSRIKIFRRTKPGSGGYAARNLGIEKASSNWICFLDADDEWNADHLLNFRQAILSNPNISIFVSSYLFSDKRGERPHKYYSKFSGQGSHIFDFERFLIHKPIWTSALCVKKRSIIDAGMFPDGKSKRGGDTDTWLRLMYLDKFGYWICNCTAIYHRDSENMVTKSVEFRITDHILYDTVEQLLNTNANVKFQNALKQHWNSTAVVYFKNMSKTKRISLSELKRFYWLAKPFRTKILLYILYSQKNIFKK